mmetsp:Transcript_16645/g.16007  ORF Transcript_16645/g.16007 Transcript_16645/m.16007 type:complete len:213 (-) Transcript_16645:1104-1742(-)
MHLLPTKPGRFDTTTPIFPNLLVTPRAAPRTRTDVYLHCTISTNFMMCAGVKKCIPTMYSALLGLICAVMRSMSREDVLDAMIQQSPHTWSSLWNSSCFTLKSSYTASITRSHVLRLWRSVLTLNLFITACPSLEDRMRPLFTAAVMMAWMDERALSRAAWDTSQRITEYLPISKLAAIPRPITPDPTTPACSTSNLELTSTFLVAILSFDV